MRTFSKNPIASPAKFADSSPQRAATQLHVLPKVYAPGRADLTMAALTGSLVKKSARASVFRSRRNQSLSKRLLTLVCDNGSTLITPTVCYGL
jgi:hypothetical protein